MKNKNILVIEDDSNIQELIVEFLSAEGYSVEDILACTEADVIVPDEIGVMS